MEDGQGTLLDALRQCAAQPGEHRLYRKGKLAGLFQAKDGELAGKAIADGLLELTRTEAAGKASIEWVRATPKGLHFLAETESPLRALQELRDTLAIHQQNLPGWAAQLQARVEELSRNLAGEINAIRQRLDLLAVHVDSAIAHIEAERAEAELPEAPWGPETLDILERRRQVGLGTRCPLADLFAALKEKHAELSIREFHLGLKRLAERELIALLPGINGNDTPGPEYALLDGPTVYYYLMRAS